MYCKNCGYQLNEDDKFCVRCGAKSDCFDAENKNDFGVKDSIEIKVKDTMKTESKNEVNSDGAKKARKKFITGVVLLILGVMAVFGGIVGGDFERMAIIGVDLSNLVTLTLEFGFIIAGIWLIAKYKGRK